MELEWFKKKSSMFKQGGVQGGIAKNSIKKIIAPVPPKSVQDNVENEVKKTLTMVIEKDKNLER